MLLERQQEGGKIIYLDETIFKPYSVEGMAWAHKWQNQDLRKHGLKLRTLAAIVCISMEAGVELVYTKPFSIKCEDLCEAIKLLERDNKLKPVTIFMDNLRSHHSRVLSDCMGALNFKHLFNAAYSSEYHCIERVFAKAKGY